MAENIQKKGFRIPELEHWSGVRRTKLYDEMKLGRLKFMKIGRITIIPIEAAEEWFASYQKLPTGGAA